MIKMKMVYYCRTEEIASFLSLGFYCEMKTQNFKIFNFD